MNITPCSLGWYKERLGSRGSKQNDSLNSVVKGTFPLKDLLLKGRESLSCLFNMKNSDLLVPNGNSVMAEIPVTAWGDRIHRNTFCNMCDEKKILIEPFS